MKLNTSKRVCLAFAATLIISAQASAQSGMARAGLRMTTSVTPNSATGSLFGTSFVPGGNYTEWSSGATASTQNSSRNFGAIGQIAGREFGPFNKVPSGLVQFQTQSLGTTTSSSLARLEMGADGRSASLFAESSANGPSGFAAAEAKDPLSYSPFFDIFTVLTLEDLEIETDEQKRANCIWESYLVDPNPGPFVKIELSIIGDPDSVDDILIEVESGIPLTLPDAVIEAQLRSSLMVTPGHVIQVTPVTFGARIMRDHPWELEFGVRTAVAPVPEPASIACFGAGILGLAWKRRSSKKAVRA